MDNEMYYAFIAKIEYSQSIIFDKYCWWDQILNHVFFLK